MAGNALIILCCFVALAGCKRTTPETTIARVDNSALTMEEIRSQMDTSRAVSQSQIEQYIQRWLNDELVYREAVRRGFDKTPELDKRVADFRRRLVINAMLESEIYNERTATSSPEEIAAYYGAHKSEFVLPQDVALVGFVLFSNRDAATGFRNSVLKGTPWRKAADQLETDPKHASTILGRIDSIYHSQASLQPPELWRVAANIQLKEPSFPISTKEGFYILIVWKYLKQGQPADQRFVEGEIRGRLAVQRRRQLYDSLITNLRAQHTIEVLTTSIPVDSTKGIGE